MTINKIQNDGKTILALSGRLDTVTSHLLQESLMPELEDSEHVELDFTELAYISSAGLRVLLMGQKTANAKAVSMTLRNVSADIMEVLEMTGFINILTIV